MTVSQVPRSARSSVLALLLSSALVALTGCGAPAPDAVQIQLLQPEPGETQRYADAGVDIVTLELGWDAYEPAQGRIDRAYVDQRAAEAVAYREAGLDVVLDLGIQYPPDWAWDLPGETRFINQDGADWRGETGNDPLDAVWNDAARDAQRDYLEVVAADFGGLVDRVRVGGLLSGEIRLPPANAVGRIDSLWAFGADALAASPDPDWRPGQGTEADARAWVDFYLASLSDYAVWLTETVGTGFPDAPIDVLLPGWGLRPGDVDAVAAGLVSTDALALTGDDLAGGLDWRRQLRALDALDLDLTAVTTWLDAPSYGSAPSELAPAEYLATLVEPLGIRMSGENTGGDGTAALARLRYQSAALELDRIIWMPDGDLDGITPEDLRTAFPR